MSYDQIALFMRMTNYLMAGFFMGMLKIMKWRISQKRMPINSINMEKAKYHWHASTIGH